jgi:hypothetical protein
MTAIRSAPCMVIGPYSRLPNTRILDRLDFSVSWSETTFGPNAHWKYDDT